MRASKTQKLLNWGYTAFDAVRLFEAGPPRGHASPLEGTENCTEDRPSEAIVVTVPSGSAGKIKTEIL